MVFVENSKILKWGISVKEFKYILGHCDRTVRRKFFLVVITSVALCPAAMLLTIETGIFLGVRIIQRVDYALWCLRALSIVELPMQALLDAVLIMVLILFEAAFLTKMSDLLSLTYRKCTKSLKQDEAREADHGRTILAVARRIRKAPVEYSAAFSPSAKKLGECTNYDDECADLTSDCITAMQNESGCIHIHNHPLYNISVPSCADMLFYSNNYIRQAIILSWDEVTILEMSADFWRNEQAMEFIEQQYKAANEQAENLSIKGICLIYQSTLSQIAEQYHIKVKILPFWRWYVGEIRSNIHHFYHHHLRKLRFHLTDITSHKKAQR